MPKPKIIDLLKKELEKEYEAYSQIAGKIEPYNEKLNRISKRQNALKAAIAELEKLEEEKAND